MSIQFTQEELDKIHKIQIEMLFEVDRICRKYDIKYIVSGGTMLGAVRNHRFIPWDDDIDIRMVRTEYERFCEACEEELDKSKYFLQNHKTDAEYPWQYGKMRYIHSKYTRVGQEHLKMQDGIFVDIIPSDGLPNNYIARKAVLTKSYILRKLLYSRVGSVTEENPVKRSAYRLMNRVPKNWVFKKMEKLEKKYSGSECCYQTSYCFCRPRQKRFIERSWHLDTIEVEFEGRKVFIPKEYDKWLLMSYGEDYMTPPPEEERVVHNEIIDFYIEEGF